MALALAPATPQERLALALPQAGVGLRRQALQAACPQRCRLRLQS